MVSDRKIYLIFGIIGAAGVVYGIITQTAPYLGLFVSFPIAEAGNPITVNEGDNVTLDGTKSVVPRVRDNGTFLVNIFGYLYGPRLKM